MEGDEDIKENKKSSIAIPVSDASGATLETQEAKDSNHSTGLTSADFKIIEEITRARNNADMVELENKLKERYREMLEELTSKIDVYVNGIEFKNKLREILDRLIKDTKKELENKIDDSKNKIIETLAVFGLFLFFIASTAQIFSRISDLKSAVIFISCIFGLSIALFLIFYFIKGEKNWRALAILSVISITLILAPLFVNKEDIALNPVQGTVEFENAVNERIDEKIKNYLEENNKKFYNKSDIDGIIKFLNSSKLK